MIFKSRNKAIVVTRVLGHRTEPTTCDVAGYGRLSEYDWCLHPPKPHLKHHRVAQQVGLQNKNAYGKNGMLKQSQMAC